MGHPRPLDTVTELVSSLVVPAAASNCNVFFLSFFLFLINLEWFVARDVENALSPLQSPLHLHAGCTRCLIWTTVQTSKSSAERPCLYACVVLSLLFSFYFGHRTFHLVSL